ncbi:MAG: hypothetical protein O2985_18465 [Proteobacteria bacterium]|nr:hypothetical protein [Pseudomonadota bacterium]
MRILFSILTILALVTPAHSETFRFPEIGLSFAGPDGWRIMSGDEFRALPNSTDFGSDQLNRIIASEDGGPFLSLIKYPMPYPGVNPGIHLTWYAGKIIDLKAAITNVEAFVSGALDDYRLIDGPALGRLGEFDSAHITYSYSAVASGAVQYAIAETMWIVPMGDNYLTVAIGAAPDADDTTTSEVRSAADSIRRLE